MKKEIKALEVEPTDNGYLIKVTLQGDYNPSVKLVVGAMSDLMMHLTRFLFEHEASRNERLNPKPKEAE
jgi:hypothetical protein